MSAYIDLGTLKTALSLAGDDTTDDALLQSTIFRASDVVDGYLAQIRPGYVGFAASSNSRSSAGSNTRYYDGTGDEWLWIDDVTSVSSVTVDDTAIDMADVVLWPYNQTPKRAIVYKDPAPPIIGRSTGAWSLGTRNIAVTGYFGHNSIPNDIVHATLSIAVLYWRRYQSGAFEPLIAANESMEGRALVRAFAITTDPEVMGILSALDGSWAMPGVYGA